MGFCCKILSLNDLTLSPISRPGTIVYNDNELTGVQTCDDDTSLFPAKPASRLGPVLVKRGSQKGLGDAWVSFHPTYVVNLA